jgi:shikimate kinase
MSQRCVTLYGPMGSGKTSVGKELADMLGYEFIDTDKLVEQQTGKKISAIFREEGEAAFREKESAVIQTLVGSQGKVIATGGGAVLDPQNRHVLASIGLSVYLKASARELYQRVKNDTNRPLLQNVEDPVKVVQNLLKEREEFYSQADIIIDTEDLSVEEVTDQLIDELARRTVGDV